MTSLMIWISDLGHGPLYLMIAISCMVWGSIDRIRKPQGAHEVFWMGWRLTSFWVIGVLLNTCLKYAIRAPRPWWTHADLAPLHPHPAGGFGMPSGHTQSAVGILLGLWCLGRLIRVHRAQRGEPSSTSPFWFTGLGILWVVGIAATRVGLHAHSIAQVCVGGIVGLAWAGVILWCERSSRGVSSLVCLTVILTSAGGWLTQYTPELDIIWTQRIQMHHVDPPSAPSLTRILIAGGVALVWAGLLRLKRSPQAQADDA